MTHAWSRKIYRIAFENCRFTEDAALCDIYLKRFFDFQCLLRRIFAFIISRYRASRAILKHYLVIARSLLWSKISIKPLSKALYQSQGTAWAAETSNLIRRTRVLKKRDKIYREMFEFRL